MRCKVWIVLLFGFLSLWLSSCTSDDSSSSTASRMNDEFGECTEDRNGEIALDSATGASYFCDNGKWTLDEDTGVFLDTLADGSYQCTDTTSVGNYAKITVADSELAYSGHIDYSTSIFSSRPFSYLQSDTLYSRFVAGRDYDFALQCNSEVFMISDAALGSFIYKHYSISGDSLIVMRCKDASYVTTQDSWTSPFNTSVTYGSFMDSRDEKTYRTVTIDSITWMAQNLNYDTAGSYCYAGKASNCSRYGRLYSWAMVMNGASASGLVPSGERGLCPDGWHVPSAAEWDALQTYADSVTDGMGAFSIRSIFNWTAYSSEYDSLNYTGTDLFGFSAVAGGYEDSLGFSELGETAAWWTASEYSSTDAMKRSLFYDREWMGEGYESKADLRSLRCVLDYDVEIPFNTSVRYGSLTDPRDGASYRTVTIGGRKWMAENLNYEVDSSSCYNDDIHYCRRYGRLYGWATAMNLSSDTLISINREPSGVQGICPEGWHLPSIAEWKTLQANLADTVSATAGLNLKALEGWTDSTGGIAGTDRYGFRALPGGQGYKYAYGRSSYTNLGRRGLWWTTVENGFAYAFTLQDSTSAISYQSTVLSGTHVSVRCVEDYLSRLDSLLGQCTQAELDTVVTRDGKSYFCDPFGWRSATFAEVVDFEVARSVGTCTVALQDSVRVIDSLMYTCDTLSWRRSTAAETLNYNVSQTLGPCTAALENTVEMPASDSLYYICRSLSWRQATDAEIDSLLVIPAFGRCTASLVDSVNILPSSGVTYICDTVRMTAFSWREATDDEEEAYIVRTTLGSCTVAREGVLDTLFSTGVVYICDSLSWRQAKDIEVDASGRGTCTAARKGVAYTGRLGTAVCTSGRWFWGKNAGTITDSRDGNVYKTIQIGSQTWMAENLRFDPTDSTDWYPAFRFSACYNDSEDSCAVYGRLYGWITAMQGSTNQSTAVPSGVQGICPVGWHIPSGGEWNILYKYVEARSYDVWVAEGLESPETWVDTTGRGYVGVDDFGFSALAGGRRKPPSIFSGVGLESVWWETNKASNSDGDYFMLDGGSRIGWGMTDGNLYFSVRCLKD